MSIKAIFFDIDGTLYPNMAMYVNSLSFLLNRRKRVFTRAFWKARKILRLSYENDLGYNFYEYQAHIVANHLNIALEEAKKEIFDLFYDSWIISFKKIKPFPYIYKLISKLKEEGFFLGVLSDFPVEKKLEYFQLDKCWDVALCSEESGYLKPHPAPFELLKEKSGFQANEILYVGNSKKYDIVGAKGVDFHTAYIVPWYKKKKSDADFSFSNYKEFEKKLSEYIKQLELSEDKI